MHLTALFVILLGTASSVAQVPAQDGCIQGKVVDTTGAPIAYVYVVGMMTDHSGNSFSTPVESDGHFRIDMTVPGEYDVSTTDELKADWRHIPSEMPTSASVVRATALSGGQCSSVVVKQTPRARLRLKARNLLTGETISRVSGEVRFSGQSAWDGTDDDNGDLLVPPNADLELQLGALGYANSEMIKIAPLRPGEVREFATSLRPIQTGCITGVVLDQQGSPVSGVRVQASMVGENLRFSPGVQPTTSLNGRFTFESMQPGDYAIFTPEVKGYPISINHEEMNPTWLVVQPTVACSEVTIRLGPKAAKLKIPVIDAVTRKRLKEANVWLNGEHGANRGSSLKVIGDPMPVPALEQFTVTAGQDGYENSHPMTVSPLRP